MAYTYLVNQTYATGALAIFNLKAQLKAAGWTVPRSSDGTTYNSSGDQITTGTSGAGGMANNGAWFVIQQPGSNRQWCFQRSTAGTNLNWRIKYTPSAGFTGGSPGATQTPSATDEVILSGGGTNASPSFTQQMGTDGTNRTHIVIGGAAESYSWVIWWMTTGGTVMQCLMCHDGMQANSYVSADTDPYVVNCSGNTSTALSGYVNALGTPRAYLGALATANAVGVGLGSVGSTSSPGAGFPGGAGVSAWSTKDVAVPVAWFRGSASAAPVGWKGFSTLLLIGSVTRTNMDTLDVTSTRDKVYLNGFWLPWNGSVPLL